MKQARKGAAPASALTGIRKLVEHIVAESDLATLPKHRLKDDLTGVLRIKHGRLRLFFIANQEAAIVLMVGYRKAGDRHDAYEEFGRLLQRGTFDQLFAELRLAKPPR